MAGAYGGELHVERGRSWEHAAEDIVALFAAAEVGTTSLAACVPIPVTVADGALEYDADLDAFRPLALAASSLAAIADAARAVAELHASGRIHGDLRPGTLRVSG